MNNKEEKIVEITELEENFTNINKDKSLVTHEVN